MKTTAKLKFTGDYYPGWQSSKSYSDKIKYLFKNSTLSFRNRQKLLSNQRGLKNKLLSPYQMLNAKMYSLHPLELLDNFFDREAYNCLNLETSLSKAGKPVPEKKYNLKCEPAFIEGLANYNINHAVLANNHILDYGHKAVLETTDWLEQYQIDYSGINFDKNNQKQDAVIRRMNNISFGFLSYVAPEIIDPSPESYFSQPIIPYRLDKELMLHDIKNSKDKTDFIIVNCHWGVEWSHLETEEQRELAHSLIDAGASVIVGHHPHVVQGVERYKNGLIAYSLGNLYMLLGGVSRKRSDKTILLEVDFSNRGMDSYKIHSINHNDNGQPYLFNGFDIDDLDLNREQNRINRNDEFYHFFKSANVTFGKNNKIHESNWRNDFTSNRLIFLDSWCSGDAYVALGKEFCGKNLKRALICHSDNYDTINIEITNFRINHDTKCYFGFPDWVDFNNDKKLELIIMFNDREVYNNYVNHSRELSYFSFNTELERIISGDLKIIIKGDNFNFLFGF